MLDGFGWGPPGAKLARSGRGVRSSRRGMGSAAELDSSVQGADLLGYAAAGGAGS